MGNLNVLSSHEVAVVGVIDPDAYAAAAYSTGWIAMADWWRIMAVIMVGDMVATALCDAKLQQATDAGGTGVKDVTGKAITQLTQAGTDDNKQAIINCDHEDLDIEGGFDFARLTVTLTTAGADMGAAVFGFPARYGPSSDSDVATVDEIIGCDKPLADLAYVRLLAPATVEGQLYAAGSELAVAAPSALALTRRGLAEVLQTPTPAPALGSDGRPLKVPRRR